ncbi:hypothetical protein J6590_028437 [Homalodisca vitripennis]|nr:hypothetical protein J6590_028437 [Homalodisca vitripennis]
MYFNNTNTNRINGTIKLSRECRVGSCASTGASASASAMPVPARGRGNPLSRSTLQFNPSLLRLWPARSGWTDLDPTEVNEFK